MGAVVTVAVGSSSYSVYALATDAVVDASAYFNGMLGAGSAAWSDASTNDKKRSLVMASDWMDRAVGPLLSGLKTVSTQPRQWPRDSATCYTDPVTDGTTPDDIANAQFYLAGVLLQDATKADATGQGSNVKIAAAEPASVTFFQPTIGTTADTRLPVTAMDLLKCYFNGAGVAGGAGVATGTGNATAFDACDYTRTEGFS